MQHGNGGQAKKFLIETSFSCITVIFIPGFSESESDIRNNIPSISSDIIGISNQKNKVTRFIKNM